MDFRPHAVTACEMEDYVKYFNKNTTFLAVKGFEPAPRDINHLRSTACTTLIMKIINGFSLELKTLILESMSCMVCKLYYLYISRLLTPIKQHFIQYYYMVFILFCFTGNNSKIEKTNMCKLIWEFILQPF